MTTIGLELLIVTTLALAGLCVTIAFQLPRWPSIWLAWPTGCSLYIFTGASMVLATGRLTPIGTLTVTAGLALMLVLLRGAIALRRSPSLAWRVLLITAATALTAMVLNPTRLTPDSLRYLVNAAWYTQNGGVDLVLGADLVKRQFGLPSLHALGSVTGLQYLPSLGPLYGVSGTGYLFWFVNRAWNRLEPRVRRTGLLVLAIFVLSTNRYVYDWFYVNTHIQVATYFLVGVAGTWLATTEGGVRWSWPAGIALASMLVLRSESPLMVATVLVAASPWLQSTRTAIALAAPSVAVTAVWYLGLLRTRAPGGGQFSLTSPVWFAVSTVMTACVLMLFLTRAGPQSTFRRIDIWGLLVGALGIVVAVAVSPSIFMDSLVASTRNVFFDGLWLLSWPALTGLTAAALLSGSGGLVHRRVFTTPILGFALLFWALPFARGAAWRVGTGDSGNRILAHIFLVVLAYLCLAWASATHRAETRAATTPESESGHGGSRPG